MLVLFLLLLPKKSNLIFLTEHSRLYTNPLDLQSQDNIAVPQAAVFPVANRG